MAKKAKAQQEQTYSSRDIVLAKVRGYPTWPGMIVDPETVPPHVAKERPSGKKSTFYCVQFFPAGDYAWIVPKDISRLQKHEIEAYINEPYRKSGDLLNGYQVALDPEKWEEARESERQELEQREADAEVDQLDSEAEDGEKKTAKSKKRKRDSEVPVRSKAKSRAKKETAEAPSKKKAVGGAKSKKNGAKANAMVESEDEGGAEAEAEGEDEDAGPSKESVPPPAKKSKRDEEEIDPVLAADPEAGKVKEWRHRLQRTFLNNKVTPKPEDMQELDELFTAVETYDNMSIQYLTFSKIGKVMRHIHILAPEKVPRDDEFKFRDRAKALVNRWHGILNTKREKSAGANGAVKSETKPDADDTAEAKEETATNMQVDAEGSADAPEEQAANGMVEEEDAKETTNAGDVSAVTETGDVSMAE